MSTSAWSSERPTRPGWFYWRTRGIETIVRIVLSGHDPFGQPELRVSKSGFTTPLDEHDGEWQPVPAAQP